MRSWLRDRSMLFQLLAGGLSILAIVVLLWLVVETRFLNELNRVNSRRWAALSMVAHFSEARQYESVGDFTQQGALASQFYTTGETPALTQHNAAMARTFSALDTLNIQLDEDQIDTEKHLRAVLATYKDDFDTLVQVYRRRGSGVSGVVGQWQAAMGTILSRAKSTNHTLEDQALHLQAAQHDLLSAPSDEHVASVIAASGRLMRSSLAYPALSAAVSRFDSIFRDYLTLSNRIGHGGTEGLHGALLTAASTVQSGVDSLLIDTVRDADAARIHFTAVTWLTILCIFGIAALFFYAFVKPIASTIERLAATAAVIGQGQFNVRVDVRGKSELGQLAASFNNMAEQLGLLMKSILQAGSQINTSTAEIAITARQQQATASEIAATTREVGNTAREISATSQELANNMKHVAAVAEQTADLAGSGQGGIAQMGTTMRQITEASDSIGARLGTLAEKTANITSVVTTIAKVADQTNLLSLNAAIEAEKAGEAGRGFSVVAHEIRRLADQTAMATGDIETIVREIQSAVTAGVMGMDKFSDEIRRGVKAGNKVGTQLFEILNQVQTLTPNFEMVNHGMQSQAEAAQQISLALSQLGTAAQQTVESLVQSNRVVEQLNEASRSLQAGVAQFKVTTT